MKKYTLFTLLLLAAFAVMSVSPIAAQDDPKAYFGDLQPEEGASLRVSGWGEESEQTLVSNALARFSELYPEVEIIFEPIPNEFDTTIKAAIAGGTAPDVFYVNADLMINLSPSGQLLALNDYMESAGVAADSYPAALMAQWTTPEGMIYGIPKDFASLAMFYNPDLFDAAGVEYPTEDWTWDDLKTAAMAITEATDAAGVCTNPDVSRWGAFLVANGGSIVTPDYSAAAINSPEAIATLNFWYDLYTSGAGANPSDIGMGWCGEAYANQAVAIAFEGNWLSNYLNQQFPDVPWSATTLPATPEGSEGNLLFQNAWGAKADTQYPNAAALLVLFLTSPMNQMAVLEDGGPLPTHLDLLNDSEFLATLDDVSRIMLGGAAVGQADYFGPQNGPVRDAASTALSEVFLGEKDVETALNDAAAKIDEILQQ